VPPLLRGALIGAALLLCAALTLWAQRTLHRARLRRRFRRAAAGQARARALLEREGFTVTAEELAVPGELEVDGVRRTFQARIDFLVERKGKSFAVEVKTGSKATDPLCRATRRQLGEYARLLPVDGFYLLDMEGPRLMQIRFPGPVGARSTWLMLGIGFLLGAAATVLLLATR
jgi:hypothetical protein